MAPSSLLAKELEIPRGCLANTTNYKRDNSPHYTTMLNGSTQHDMFIKLITWAESAKHNQFLKWVVSYHLFKSVMTRLKSLNRLTK
jgi:hypothetical protein